MKAVLTADELLAGPRGRALCLAAAQSLGYGTWPYEPGQSVRPLDRMLAMVGAVDASPLREARDPLDFLESMDQAVVGGRYWQEPDEGDLLAADPAMIAAMRPLAESIVASPAAAWWDTGADLATLRYTSRFDSRSPVRPPEPRGIGERLDTWRRAERGEEIKAATDRPADPRDRAPATPPVPTTAPGYVPFPGAQISGWWWSVPGHAQPVITTRPLPGLGAVSLMWKEDSGGERDASVWPLEATVIDGPPRIWEISRPRDWARLVETHPLEVTRSRQHDWYRATGRMGRWAIPDWRAVAGDVDAVHLSVAGYLTTAGRALPLADGETATVMAGFSPDETWWLTESIAPAASEPERWRLIDDAEHRTVGWRRVGP